VVTLTPPLSREPGEGDKPKEKIIHRRERRDLMINAEGRGQRAKRKA
jgi:hypothetical protein